MCLASISVSKFRLLLVLICQEKLSESVLLCIWRFPGHGLLIYGFRILNPVLPLVSGWLWLNNSFHFASVCLREWNCNDWKDHCMQNWIHLQPLCLYIPELKVFCTTSSLGGTYHDQGSFHSCKDTTEVISWLTETFGQAARVIWYFFFFFF